MASVLKCDITGSTKDVKRFTAMIVSEEALEGIRENNSTVDDFVNAAIYCESVDLCPKALERLRNFLKRGTKSPNPD